MKEKKRLEDITEPCYFDFIYEEIRQQNEAEILNTIVFESIIRTNEIKSILKTPSFKENLDQFLYSQAQGTITNPLYERISYFKKEIDNFYKMLETLKVTDTNNTIAEEDIIELFFKGDIHKYKNSLDTLHKIKSLIDKDLFPNIELNIDLSENENIENYDTPINYKLFIKYGLEITQLFDYFKELEPYLIEAKEYKQILYDRLLRDDKDITNKIRNDKNAPNKIFKQYSNQIQNLVKKYRTFAYTEIHLNNKTIISIGKRPISKLLNILEIKLSYLPNDTTTKRVMKALNQLSTQIDEHSLKENTKSYSSLINQPKFDILTMKPETFSQTLFVYDYLEYIKNKKEIYQKEAISYLIYMYPKLGKKTQWKSIENRVNKLKKFIRYLENST